MAENLSMKNVSNESLQATLLNTVFKGANYDQLVSLIIVANQYGLNPFTKEIYAFPSKGSITPIVSVDGWSRIINDNPQCDGIQFEQDDVSATCKIYRKDRTHPTIVTEYLSECEMTNSPVWKKYPKRMLRHKALIQCARIAFGFSGIYDEDEAKRIDGGITTVVSDAEPVNDGYSEFYNAEYPRLLEAANKGTSELIEAQKLLNTLDNKDHAKRLWAAVSPELKQVAQKADMNNADDIIDAEIIEDEPTTTA
ncbi:recombinase RecT [Psychrobacter glacincola]|uniref:recombinase RecT n=1 Tax=Psychrobacter glacincola TaxID=56810 RepID=UPI0039AFFB47